MKNIKRFASVVMVLMMMLSMMIPAMAASITIDLNVTGGTETGETYSAYLIFSADFAGTTLDEDTNVAYTIDSNSPYFETIGDSNYFTLNQVNSTTTYIVEPNDTYNDTAAKTLAAALSEISATAVGEGTYKDGKYTITGLENGYYLVVSSLGSALVLDTFGDVEIDTKNNYPSLTKKIVDGDKRVDTITADWGSTVTFEISVTIPETAVGPITVHDKIDDNMTLGSMQNSSVSLDFVWGNDCDCKCTNSVTLSAATVAANLGKTVTYQYTATLNANAATATAHKNTAWLTYSNFTSIPDEVTVYTYEVDVFKYTKNGETETGLAGAGFVLKNTDGKYYCNTDGVVTWVDSEDDATEYTTAADNYTVTFAGIKNGTYTLHEKTVPVGYNPAAQDATVTVADANVEDDFQIKVLNQSGTELPSTGGIGTTIFYCVGAVLAVGAFVLLITKKRMSREM